MRSSILKFIKVPIVFLSELVLLVVFFLAGVYKSIFFQGIFSAIGKIPVFSQVRSLLIIAVMVLPILVTLYLLNFRFLKLSLKTLLLIQLVLVTSILVFLEIILQLV